MESSRIAAIIGITILGLEPLLVGTAAAQDKTVVGGKVHVRSDQGMLSTAGGKQQETLDALIAKIDTETYARCEEAVRESLDKLIDRYGAYGVYPPKNRDWRYARHYRTPTRPSHRHIHSPSRLISLLLAMARP